MKMYQAMISVNGGPYEPVGDPTPDRCQAQDVANEGPAFYAFNWKSYVHPFEVCDECQDELEMVRNKQLCGFCGDQERDRLESIQMGINSGGSDAEIWKLLEE